MILTQVSNGIHKSEELIKRIKNGDASVYHHSGGIQTSSTSMRDKESFGHTIYKHLMSGVSNMLPFVVGGALAITDGSGFLGALVAGFAAGYIFVGLKKLFGFLPKSLEGIKPVLLYPVFGILIIGIG